MIAMMSLPIMALPAKAQTAPTQKSYAIIDAIPNPVGVGEQVLLKYGVLQPLGSANEGWTGITITVVKPDNTTTTLGPFTTDSTGSSFTTFTPDQVGTYKLTTNFPDNIVQTTFFDLQRGSLIFAGTKELAATAELDLVVQQDPLPNYPGHALPTEYWSRPIDPQLREWYSISGDWVSRPPNDIALFNDNAPETAHVLWANDITTGGLAGGLLGDGQVPAASESGDAYEGKFTNSVVLNGILYYNPWSGAYSGPQPIEPTSIVAVDLHTGEVLWTKQNAEVSFGQELYFNSFNVDGVYTYLWDTYTKAGTWMAYDPFNGNNLYNMTNVPSGLQYYGPSGEILILQTDWANGWMALWNSTACGQQGQSFNGANQPDYGSWGRIVQMRTLDASNRESYSWNVTIPKGLQPGGSLLGDVALKIYPDRIVGLQFNQTQVRAWALSWPTSTNTTTASTILFDKTWAAPSEWLAGDNTIEYTGATNDLANGVIAVWSKELRQHYGFSVESGNYLWTTATENYADAYGWGNVEHTWYFAYGKLYSVGIGGTVYAYDLATGKTAWTYNMADPYNEPVTGNYWWGWITLIADGKIYVGTVEHSAENPLPRGAPQICINATDGTEVWRVNGMFRDTRWGGNGVIGDSIIGTMDTYDQRVYAIGKGPSETTVSLQDDTVSIGDSVLLKGTVTDTSPGTNTVTMKLRFPNGVPAVADAFQSDWMLYVYKQFSPPSNATGVPVSINVLDSNGNYRQIGTTTSDSNGHYSFQWAPDISGKYTVYVTFSGSKAYYGSFGETSFAVSEAHPTAAPTSTPISGIATTSDLMISIAVAVIAIIIAIAVATVLILRKRP